MLNKNNAFLFKVTNVNHRGLGTNFRLYCPKERNHHKMMIFKNGTTKDNLQYKDLCKEEHHVRIAYNNVYNQFYIIKLDNIDTMDEFAYWRPISFEMGRKSHHHVILKTFFKRFNIKPTWINCNGTSGVFNETTGHWTGAVGQVEIINK